MQKTLREMITESNLEACAKRNEADVDRIAELEAELAHVKEYEQEHELIIEENVKLKAELAEIKAEKQYFMSFLENSAMYISRESLYKFLRIAEQQAKESE